MTDLGGREADVRDNVAHVLEANGLRSSVDLMRSALDYILSGTPTNLISAHRNRLIPEEQHALSVLCLAVDASLDSDQPLVSVRARLDEVRKALAGVRG